MSDLLGLLQLLLVGLAIAGAYAIAWTMYRLTHPPRRTYAHAVSRGKPGDPGELPPGPGGAARSFESWTFRTSDGLMLPVWEMTGDAPAGPVLILTHGWGDSRIGALTRVQPLLGHVSRAIMWDMRGSGDAPGTCRLGTSEVDDLRRLVRAVHEGMTSERAPPGSERAIVLLGWSLGAGVSIAAAHAQHSSAGTATPQIAAVIAEAPYRLAITPARNVIRGTGVPTAVTLRVVFWLLGTRFGVGPRWQGFDRAAHASNLACPLLVIQGVQDEVCPVADGREIARAAARGAICQVESGGHHSLWTNPDLAAQSVTAAREVLDRLRSA